MSGFNDLYGFAIIVHRVNSLYLPMQTLQASLSVSGCALVGGGFSLKSLRQFKIRLAF